MYMNSLTKYFLSVYVVTLCVIGWVSSFPNEFGRRKVVVSDGDASLETGMRFSHEYYWEYPIGVLIFGLVLFLVTWPLGPLSFLRWLIAFSISACLTTYLFFIGMHAPPAYGYTLLAVFLASLVCLFMSGYALGAKEKYITSSKTNASKAGSDVA